MPLQARTVYRCVQAGTVSLATAPEPGSKCLARELDDNAATMPDLWGTPGRKQGKLYRREQDGTTVFSTRELPGSVAVLGFAVPSPSGAPAHVGLGNVGRARPELHARAFEIAATANRIDPAWLRAVAHAESGFRADAVSPKGALGVMQLLPATAKDYGVTDPFSAAQSIAGGARHLARLLRRYDGDRVLAAAAYNAGEGAVARYGGVPPYAETEAYVAKVDALYALYAEALQ
ncbi:MAG TPA: lytic transglycosylase domain-containing protein [Candidatus Saccharimonadia bacterium]|nr:lytic transglycosylase domain-containing protein [Candidatus Saccharimonadia bacterium]